jgi:ABC-2 type transport system ATP-binding protein
MSGDAILHVRGLRKAYGDVFALRGADLDVAAGEIVSLLGPNGAGKTTLVSIVAGLRKPDDGVVEVAGRDVRNGGAAVRRLIGLAPQDLGIYPVVSVRHNLELFGRLAGLGRRNLRERVDQVAGALGISQLLDRRAGTLSGGQKRRLHTAIAMLHHPPLLLLDEATTGADVETRGQILELVRRLASEGSAVVYSTHYLQEVEQLEARVALLDDGRVIAHGDVQGLIAAHADPVVELTFDGEIPQVAELVGGELEGGRVRLRTADPVTTLREVLPALPPGALASIEVVRPSLEAVYLALTGRRYEQEGVDDEHVGPA